MCVISYYQFSTAVFNVLLKDYIRRKKDLVYSDPSTMAHLLLKAEQYDVSVGLPFYNIHGILAFGDVSGL